MSISAELVLKMTLIVVEYWKDRKVKLAELEDADIDDLKKLQDRAQSAIDELGT